jgi:SAM-dependent methyltransferase
MKVLDRARPHRGARQDSELRFSDHYVSCVASKLAEERVHKTLGRTEWSAGKLEEQKRCVERLRYWGLKPYHRCVDYGCGSLRIGQHLIPFLNRGNYIGLDVTATFFPGGLGLLGEELVREKRPNLLVIRPETIFELEQEPPDFLLSNAVLHHVHPSELDDYLDNILQLTGTNTQAFVTFKEWTREIQVAEKSWAHSAQSLVERIAALDPCVEVTILRRKQRNGRWARWDPSWKSIFRLTRKLQ